MTPCSVRREGWTSPEIIFGLNLYLYVFVDIQCKSIWYLYMHLYISNINLFYIHTSPSNIISLFKKMWLTKSDYYIFQGFDLFLGGADVSLYKQEYCLPRTPRQACSNLSNNYKYWDNAVTLCLITTPPLTNAWHQCLESYSWI